MIRGRTLIAAATMLLWPTSFAMAAGSPAMTFAAGCDGGERITVAAAGDLLFHKRLQLQAYRKGADFKRFFTPLAGLLSAADITYGNLEGPAARGVAIGGRAVKDPGRRLDGRVYSAHLKTLSFNYHPSVVTDLQSVGFDVLSLANNHILDRGALGVDRTVEAFDAAGMAFTGARHRDALHRPWSTIIRARGVAVAWLACTYSTNGFPDRNDQTLDCFQEQDAVLREIDWMAGRPDVDAVILVPHWGVENRHRPRARQKALAEAAIEAGALAVIATHPHVLQPWAKHVTQDGREGLIVYSTGNFISNQRRLMERAGALVLLELVKPANGKARLAAAGFVPTWVTIDAKGHRVGANPGKGWPAQALARTLKLLPDGNRVAASWPPALAKACDAMAAPAPSGAKTQHR